MALVSAGTSLNFVASFVGSFVASFVGSFVASFVASFVETLSGDAGKSTKMGRNPPGLTSR
jgi:hypothetical protein